MLHFVAPFVAPWIAISYQRARRCSTVAPCRRGEATPLPWKALPKRALGGAICRAVAVSVAFSIHLASHGAEPLRLAGEPAELSIHEVSDRTIRIELAPLDERG